jgi:hypothetical protein
MARHVTVMMNPWAAYLKKEIFVQLDNYELCKEEPTTKLVT